MTRWASSCGWESGKYTEQVASFVSGHVTGYPACDFVTDAFFVDISVYLGAPLQLALTTETAVIFSNEVDGTYAGKPDGPLSGLGTYVGSSGKYSLMPYVRHGPTPFTMDPVTTWILGELTYVLVPRWAYWLTVMWSYAFTELGVMVVAFIGIFAAASMKS